MIELRHSLPEGATIDDLIIANVKKTVQTVCESEVSHSLAALGALADTFVQVIQENWKNAKETGKQPVYVHG